jgi:hypothetical protein
MSESSSAVATCPDGHPGGAAAVGVRLGVERVGVGPGAGAQRRHALRPGLRLPLARPTYVQGGQFGGEVARAARRGAIAVVWKSTGRAKNPDSTSARPPATPPRPRGRTRPAPRWHRPCRWRGRRRARPGRRVAQHRLVRGRWLVAGRHPHQPGHGRHPLRRHPERRQVALGQGGAGRLVGARCSGCRWRRGTTPPAARRRIGDGRVGHGGQDLLHRAQHRRTWAVPW